ncbi:MAG: riboflavin synthase [Micrococcaceae bacterium]
MFTGIIAEKGKVLALTHRDADALIKISAPKSAKEMQLGASIAVNGICLSAIEIDGDSLTMEVMGETLNRTNIGDIQVDDEVNLELPMRAGAFLDGHIVQGHVDGTGKIVNREDHGQWETVRFVVPKELAKYITEKGSIAIDGTSLTVTEVSELNELEQWFEVGLIPITRADTVLGIKKVGDSVNLEVDVVAKYVERLAGK